MTRPTPPCCPIALRRRTRVLPDGRVWADERWYPLTVALLELWARPWSTTALQRAAWRIHIAEASGILTGITT